MEATIAICIILLVICVLSVRSYIKKVKNGCCGAEGDEVKRIRPQEKETSHYTHAYQIEIEGMHCKNCALRIENAFHAQDTYYATVNLKGKNAVVYAKMPVSEEDLKQIVRRAGYQVTGVQMLNPEKT